MDYEKLATLRRSHPAWRLLLASHAPLVASFLHEVFIAPNVRTLSQSALRSKLDDVLFRLREAEGVDAFLVTLSPCFQRHIDEAADAIHEYIEVFFNRRRRHTTLGGKSPAVFEALAERQLTQAA